MFITMQPDPQLMMTFMLNILNWKKVRNSFLRTGPKVWNALLSDFQNLSKFTFQKNLKHKLVELLAKADDYLEITQTIHAVKLT